MEKAEYQALKGEEASRILSSDVFTQAFEDVRQALLKQWEELPTADKDTAYDIHRRLKCLGDIKTALTVRIQTGKLIEAKIAKAEKMSALQKFGKFVNRNNAFTNN